MIGKGDGTFKAAITHAVCSGAGSIAAGDFNADGRADLAITCQTDAAVQVLLNRCPK